MIPTLPLLLALAAPALGAPLPPAVQAAWDASGRYPQDYASAVSLGQQAEAAGLNRLACVGWARAREISRGSLVSQLGEARCRLALGEHDRAAALADGLVRGFPDSADAHLIQAEVLRTDPGPLPDALQNLRAAHATAHAVELAPSDPLARCADGWARLRLGDRFGARAAFEQASGPCAEAGQQASRPAPVQVYGGLYVTGLQWAGQQGQRAGASTLVDASARIYELVDVGASVRVGQNSTRGQGESQTYEQSERWLRAGVSHAGHGARLIGGWIDGGGDSDTTATVLGARAWTTWWATLAVEGATVDYSDGSGWQGAASLSVPVTNTLSVQAGLGISALTLDAAADGATTGRSASGEALVHGLLAAHLRRPDWTLSAGVRLGEEIRPVRLDEPTLWNLTDRIVGSGFVRGTVSATAWLDVYAGYELLQLQDSFDASTSQAHAFTGGLGVHF